MGKVKSSRTEEALICLLRSLAPLSCVYTTYRFILTLVVSLLPSPSLPSRLHALHLPLALEVIIYAEAIFYLYIIWRGHVLSRRRTPPALSLQERELILERLIAHTEDMKEMVSGWFMDVPFEELRKEDLEKFVAWMLFSKHIEEVDEGYEQDAINKGIHAIEKAANHTLRARQKGEAEHFVMRHTVDPLRYKHRPLIIYLLTHVLVNAVVGNLAMYFLGFRRYQAHHITYWRRPAAAIQSKSQVMGGPPVVFVHGIGLGLIMYINLLRHLAKNIPTDVFLIELPHASLKVCEFVPSSSQAVKSVLTMLGKHGHKRAVFSSHSLGSVYLSWMCRYAPQAVAASIFIEPIVFMLFLKTVTRNFLYHDYGGSIGFIIRSELFLNHALRRHFWWHENVLWLEDVDHPCHVFLCHQDEVVPSMEVVTYINQHDRGHRVTTEMMDEPYHGAWLLSPTCRQRIADTIERVWAAVPHFFLEHRISSIPLEESETLLSIQHERHQATTMVEAREIPMSERGLLSGLGIGIGSGGGGTSTTHKRRRSFKLGQAGGIGDGELTDVFLDEAGNAATVAPAFS